VRKGGRGLLSIVLRACPLKKESRLKCNKPNNLIKKRNNMLVKEKE
jgi:hypothetical protein